MKLQCKALVLSLAICVAFSGCAAGNISASSQSTAVPASGALFDYSQHTNADEAMYKTVLADPARLREGKPVFALEERVADWSRMPFAGFSEKDDIWGHDVRSRDISKEDLSVVKDLNDLSFNSDTKWPAQLPEGFDPQQILEYNKNPGLGIRAIHDSGITGAGVGVAIIDQPLLLEHEQYKDNLMYYERIHCSGDEAAMHGPAVASIAVGKDIGVAPGAKLYYIAEEHGHYGRQDYEFDASIIGDSILRVLQINQELPQNEKIRVISISKGYGKDSKGYKELTEAIDKANAENIFVVTTSTAEYYDFFLFGMNRDYAGNPDDFGSYLPAGWIAADFYANPGSFQNNLLVPMGSRTYAACMGTSDYEIGREGGMSWAVPWFAGFYALCCQANPAITPEEFIKAVEATSVTTQISKDGQSYPLGKIVNPAAALEKLAG